VTETESSARWQRFARPLDLALFAFYGVHWLISCSKRTAL